MSPKTKKIIILSVVILLAAGGGYAYYLYNKGPMDVRDASGTRVAATDLYQAYAKDSLQAKKTYTNQVVEASGVVEKVSQNQQNQAIVLLKTSDSGAFINCTMEGPAQTIKEKETVKLKGICTGIGSGDADLGILGDVYLVRCYLAN